jgi:hypothetical protein
MEADTIRTRRRMVPAMVARVALPFREPCDTSFDSSVDVPAGIRRYGPGMALAILLALGSALAYALAAVFQQRAAREVPEEHSMRLGLLWRLIRRPLWLGGAALDWLGFGFQAASLGLGSLILVQPVLCTGLLFALPIGARWAGRRLTRSDWTAASGLTVALVVFLLVGDPSEGRNYASGREWLVAGGVTAVLVGVAVLFARRTQGSQRALLLALAVAVLYGFTGALTKSAVHLLGEGLDEFFTSWEPYVGAAAAFLGMLLDQSSFQAGPLEASLPTLTAVEPVAAAVLGASLFEESLRAHGVLEWTVVVVSAVVILVAVLVLAKSAARAEERVVVKP